MFSSKQFGFRSKRSTINAFAEITEHSKQKITDTIAYMLLDSIRSTMNFFK